MTSFTLLITLGTCMMLPLFSLCNDSPTVNPNEIDEDCRQSALDPLTSLETCIKVEFTDEKVNETIRMTNESQCPTCQHLCRKREQVNDCIKEGMKSLKEVSNRTAVMMPFLELLLEEGLTGFCENEAHMISVFGDDGNIKCLRETGRYCFSPSELNDDNIGELFFYDHKNPRYNLDSSPFICQRMMNILNCVEMNSTSCTAESKNALAIVVTLLRKSESCSRHY